jgi:hypothetical protein
MEKPYAFKVRTATQNYVNARKVRHRPKAFKAIDSIKTFVIFSLSVAMIILSKIQIKQSIINLSLFSNY